MNDCRTLDRAEPASAAVRFDTYPLRRILLVDDDSSVRHLLKPFTSEELLEKVKIVLSKNDTQGTETPFSPPATEETRTVYQIDPTLRT